jgi:hypothetical protein
MWDPRFFQIFLSFAITGLTTTCSGAVDYGNVALDHARNARVDEASLSNLTPSERQASGLTTVIASTAGGEISRLATSFTWSRIGGGTLITTTT